MLCVVTIMIKSNQVRMHTQFMGHFSPAHAGIVYRPDIFIAYSGDIGKVTRVGLFRFCQGLIGPVYNIPIFAVYRLVQRVLGFFDIGKRLL